MMADVVFLVYDTANSQKIK